MKRALLLLASCLALGCAPNLNLRTPAPPATTLRWNSLDDKVELTQGIAAGFALWCEWGRCVDVRAVTDAPGVAQVHLAHMHSPYPQWDAHTVPGITLVGVAPGQTTLHVSQGTHVRDVAVTVLPAPPPEAAHEAKR